MFGKEGYALELHVREEIPMSLVRDATEWLDVAGGDKWKHDMAVSLKGIQHMPLPSILPSFLSSFFFLW